MAGWQTWRCPACGLEFATPGYYQPAAVSARPGGPPLCSCPGLPHDWRDPVRATVMTEVTAEQWYRCRTCGGTYLRTGQQMRPLAPGSCRTGCQLADLERLLRPPAGVLPGPGVLTVVPFDWGTL